MNIRKLQPKKFYKIGPRSPRRMLRRRVSSTGDFGMLESEKVSIQEPESWIWDPEYGIREPEYWLCYPEYGICDPEYWIWDPEYGICYLESRI